MSSPFSENPYQTPQAPIGPPPFPSPFGSPRYCTEAIVALVCSIVGPMVCAILLEPTALVLSIIALKKIREDPYLKGRGMAIAAVVISIAIIALNILALLFFFGVAVRRH